MSSQHSELTRVQTIRREIEYTTLDGIAARIADLEEQLETLTARNQFLSTEQVRADVAEAALTELKEQYEGLRSSIRFCPNCAHGYEWQESDPVEGLCPGCRRAFRIEEQLETYKVWLKLASEERDGFKEQLEAARKERSDAVEVAARAMDRSQSLQEQLEALRNVLLKIVGPNPNFDPDGQHDYGWEQPPPKPFAPGWVRDLANDALVASSPASEPRCS